METIPEEFRRYWRVFSEELSKRFPLNRNPNMTIKLLPDAPKSIKCKPYPRSKAEGKIEEDWIKQEKDLGRIVEGTSEYVSPVFFIGKKGTNEKRIIINYRRLNAWTVKTTTRFWGYGKQWKDSKGTCCSLNLTYGMATTTYSWPKRTNTRQLFRCATERTSHKYCTLGCAMHPRSFREL
jgi:hypothetical protein